jgi:hypothetical protein
VGGALILFTASALAQSDRGTITGTVVDSSGAVVPGAKIALINSATNLRQETSTTETGNYAVTSLPAGRYTLSVEQPGFTRYEQSNILIQVAETTRLDVALKIGQATESVEVVADASMLKTESAEQSSSVTGDTINTLPMNYGIGAGAVRNPLSFVQLTPGAMMTGWNQINVNGLPAGSFRILFEGQESNNGLDGRASDEVQPSVDAIQQFTLQTSNFAAEFGQVAGGLFNFTARSGTNQLHGSAYLYATNEDLNAGAPYTSDGQGHHLRPFERRFDGGVSLGGPVYIPKVYNGKNRTFFFFNYEKYRDRSQTSLGYGTVPTDAFRAGDFSSILTNRNLGTDFAGRPILENTIYDPGTSVTDSSGRYVLNPFPGNVIPTSRFDAVAVKTLTYIPKPTVAGGIAYNYLLLTPFHKIQDLPSFKIDHNLTTMARVNFYYAKQITDKDVGQDGFPDPISIRRLLHILGTNARLNFDDTLTPHLLLHLGAGVQRYVNPDSSPEVNTSFDEGGLLGLAGTPGTGFPRFSGVGNNTWGGLSQSPSATSTNFGPSNRGAYYVTKPTGLAQLTWVHGSHTYKTGGEWKIDAFTNWSAAGLSPAIGFSTAQTAQPLYGGVIPGGTTIGNAWASFLLGLYNSASLGNVSQPQYRKSSWALFVQDTWKVTRKLTLDYGLRWDLQKPMRELNARTSGFNRSIVNPAANGILGGVIYEGNGPGRCNCDLVASYPYGIGPRIGLAYQWNQKTVIRAGWGLVYSFTNVFGYIGGGNSQGMGFNTISFPSPGNGLPAGKLSNGFTYNSNDLYGASYNPGLLVSTTGTNSAPNVMDPNGGRPPRVNQWNVSVQRELYKNLVVEGAYVGNRGAWIAANNLVGYNTVNPATLKALGLDITNATTRNLLTSSITSSAAVAAGFKKPYANFPDTGTVIQSLRPFPQYGTIGTSWAPLGHTWYDSFQAKATKRYSHGLDFSVSYAYSKNLDSWEGNGDVYDRSSFKSLASYSQPHILTINTNYRLPAYGLAARNRYAKVFLADWTIGAVMQYSSGLLIAAPSSNNALGTYLPGQSSRMFRVPGQPLFLKNPNCGCYDPTKETILNPAAWVDTAPGVWGSAAVYYNDFRAQRRPSESLSIGKAFPIKERYTVRVRGEFFNIFNRNVSLPPPQTSGPGFAPATYSNGLLTGGFGFVNYTTITTNNQNNTYPAPRAGQVVVRFEF